MAAPKVPENATDFSSKLKETASNKHQHPVNLGGHPGTGKRSDFDPGGPEVPARAQRERVNPAVANDARREPLITVTSIHGTSGNHDEVPPPKAL
jgi:hypothetical protein